MNSFKKPKRQVIKTKVESIPKEYQAIIDNYYKDEYINSIIIR